MPQERSKTSSPRSLSRLSQAYLPIEDFAVIGNLHTVALVGKNGSIDWCCIRVSMLPAFSGPDSMRKKVDSSVSLPPTPLGWNANNCICQIPISSLRVF